LAMNTSIWVNAGRSLSIQRSSYKRKIVYDNTNVERDMRIFDLAVVCGSMRHLAASAFLPLGFAASFDIIEHRARRRAAAVTLTHAAFAWCGAVRVSSLRQDLGNGRNGNDCRVRSTGRDSSLFFAVRRRPRPRK